MLPKQKCKMQNAKIAKIQFPSQAMMSRKKGKAKCKMQNAKIAKIQFPGQAMLSPKKERKITNDDER